VRRVGRYEVVTYQNSTVPDVIVHAAADTRPIPASQHPAGSSADHVTSDDVTSQVQSPDGVKDRQPHAAAGVWITPVGDGRKLSTCGSVASFSLPQLSPVSDRQKSALDETGNTNVSLNALHAAAYADAASQRQTLIRSRACRPCHDLSKVTVDRPRFGSHFRLSATVADIASGGERTTVAESHDRSAMLQNVIVCDPVHQPVKNHRGWSSFSASDMVRPPDPGTPTTRVPAVDAERSK